MRVSWMAKGEDRQALRDHPKHEGAERGRVCNPEFSQGGERIWCEEQSEPESARAARPLADPDIPSRPAQGNGSGKPADAAADDQGTPRALDQISNAKRISRLAAEPQHASPSRDPTTDHRHFRCRRSV